MARSSSQLCERVLSAAENALKRNASVGPLELLPELGFLYSGHFDGWTKGVPALTPLEPHIQCGAAKLAEVYRVFAEWAAAKKLKTVEAEYSRRGVGGVEALQVTVDGSDERERFFRTHYASAELSEKKTERLQKKLTKAPDLVVFITVADGAHQIAEHAAERGSSRVGRSAAGRELDPNAITLAVVAHIRHVHTHYDSLLMRGVDRQEAREQIRGVVDKMLQRWSAPI